MRDLVDKFINRVVIAFDKAAARVLETPKPPNRNAMENLHHG